MRALIDTCVIVDVLQSREPFFKDAQKLFLLAANRQFVGCITAKSSTDIYYLMHRFTHDDKKSRDVLNKLFNLFETVDTAGIDCRRAIPSPVADYEDAVMLETAVRTEADCIITRDLHDYSNSPLPVYSPGEFIKKLEKEQDI